MRIAISPYEISGRTVAAAAAPLLVGSSGIAVTLRPEPLEGADAASVTRASRDVPDLADFLELWTWTRALWRRGLLRADLGDCSPIDAIRSVCDRIQSDPQLAPLARRIRPDLFEATPLYLRAVLADLAGGRGNPQVTIPVEAGMELFASECSIPLLRAEVRSPVRLHPHRADSRVCRFTIPIIMNTDADAITDLLDELDGTADHLALALQAVTEELYAHGHLGPRLPSRVDQLHSSSDAFAHAATAAATEAIQRAETDLPTPRLILAQITVRLCSAFDSLRTAAAGFRRLGGVRAGDADPEPGSVALSHPASERLVLLVAKALPWDPGASGQVRPQTDERAIPAEFGPS